MGSGKKKRVPWAAVSGGKEKGKKNVKKGNVSISRCGQREKGYFLG